MKTKLLLTVITIAFFNAALFAQTPIVLTLKASGVSSTETPKGSANISISATLNGAVNANGTNCTVSFEYGLTTSYGNTVSANPGTVTGSYGYAVAASVVLNYFTTGQERLIHYRLKVTNEYGTYYSRDFTAIPIDPTRNIAIIASCSDSQTMANFDMNNNNNTFDVTVDYNAGASYTGSVIIGTYQTQQVFVGKGSVCAFYYHYSIFRQVFTNDQLCSETALPRQKIFMTATGKIASDKMMFRIENGNSSSVNIEITCGS